MLYCNDFSKLSVLSLYEGELLGVVDKLYFDKKLKKLLLVELVGVDGAKLELPTKNIYHVGKNAITVRNNQAVNLKVEESCLCSCPINLKAYSINGEFLGIVKEISFDERFLTEKLSLDNGNTLEISKIASCGKNTVIFYENTHNVDVKKFVPAKSPKIFKTKVATQTQIQPINLAKDKTEERMNEMVEKKDLQPKEFSQNFLIGRVCTKDIFNFNNELLIKAHSVVNKKNLKEINKFGKIRELMLYSK